MEEEKEIRLIYGNTEPFKVPDGYFETLNRRLIAGIPGTDSRSNVVPMWRHWAIIGAVAASVCAILFGATVWMQRYHTPDTASATTEEAYVMHESSIDEAADFLMMDDDDIFSYIAEN